MMSVVIAGRSCEGIPRACTAGSSAEADDPIRFAAEDENAEQPADGL
jgi:hypothetical protein